MVHARLFYICWNQWHWADDQGTRVFYVYLQMSTLEHEALQYGAELAQMGDVSLINPQTYEYYLAATNLEPALVAPPTAATPTVQDAPTPGAGGGQPSTPQGADQASAPSSAAQSSSAAAQISFRLLHLISFFC